MARRNGYSIIKRKRNGRELENFEVRIPVPSAWQSIIGKKETLKSLRTGDRREASLIAAQIVSETLSEWKDQVEGKSTNLNQATDAATIAVQAGYDDLINKLKENRKAWPSDNSEYLSLLQSRKNGYLQLLRRFQDDALEAWEPASDKILNKEGLKIEKGSEDYQDFVRKIAEASVGALDVFIRQSSGELDAAPRSPLVRSVKEKSASLAKPGERMLELFERWSDEMLATGEKRPDSVNEGRKVVKQFSEFVGVDHDIRSITPTDVAAYRDTLRNLPPKWMSKRELRDLNMRTAAEKARALNMPQTAHTTINKHLSTISPLFKWLARQPAWAGLRNPCDGLFYSKVKGKNHLPPFTTEMLNHLLNTPLFTGFKSDGFEHIPGDMKADDWRYWIPLVVLFTGARIGEIAQLQINDVRKDRGVWFIHIRHEDREGLSTKSKKSRSAAVHNTLEKMGFLKFHSRQIERNGGKTIGPLFPELTRNQRGQISGKPSRWWRDYLVRVGIKDRNVKGGDGYGSHSFRHTLSDRLRSEAEILDNEVAVCLGHSTNTTTSGYGELPQGTVNMLKGWMDAVRFDGVEFGHLIPVPNSP